MIFLLWRQQTCAIAKSLESCFFLCCLPLHAPRYSLVPFVVHNRIIRDVWKGELRGRRMDEITVTRGRRNDRRMERKKAVKAIWRFKDCFLVKNVMFHVRDLRKSHRCSLVNAKEKRETSGKTLEIHFYFRRLSWCSISIYLALSQWSAKIKGFLGFFHFVPHPSPFLSFRQLFLLQAFFSSSLLHRREEKEKKETGRNGKPIRNIFKHCAACKPLNNSKHNVMTSWVIHLSPVVWDFRSRFHSMSFFFLGAEQIGRRGKGERLHVRLLYDSFFNSRTNFSHASCSRMGIFLRHIFFSLSSLAQRENVKMFNSVSLGCFSSQSRLWSRANLGRGHRITGCYQSYYLITT